MNGRNFGTKALWFFWTMETSSVAFLFTQFPFYICKFCAQDFSDSFALLHHQFLQGVLGR